MPKNSFVVYHNYRDVLEDLTDDQVGKLFRAMLDYEIDRVEPQFSGVLNVAFKFIKKDLDINLTKYDNICERNRQNGQKGGAPIGNQNARKQPKQPKQPEDDNDNDIVSKKERKNILQDIDISNTHAYTHESYDEIFESFGVSSILKPTLIEFIKHCQLNGKMVTNEKLKNIIVRLDMYHNEETDKVKSVNNAIMGGYFDIIDGK